MKSLKKILKWFGITILLLLLVLFITIQLRWDRTFEAPYPEITATIDSAVLAKGAYLVNGPAHCNECHIQLNEYASVLEGKNVPPAGGFEFVLPFGSVYTKNITPDKTNGIGRYTDGEIARVLRYGIRPDGTALIDFMNFYQMSDEDLTAVISYLRSLPAVSREIPENKWNFLGKALLSFLIKPSGPVEGERPKSVSPDTTAVYGKYLANSIANCGGCHTNRDLKTGKYIGEPFSGGFKMEDATGESKNVFCYTPNLTPDPTTGHMFSWTEADFITRFRSGKLIKESAMPWGPFKNFSDNDLKAIFAYLKSLPPSENKIAMIRVVE